MKKFTFKDGTEKVINEDDTYRGTLRVTQPAKNPGDYAYDTEVFVPTDVVTASNKAQRYGREKELTAVDKEILAAVQVGVLRSKIDIGLLRGTYVPLMWNKINNKFEIVVSTLTNETVLVRESQADPDFVKRVNALTNPEESAKTEEVAEEVATT